MGAVLVPMDLPYHGGCIVSFGPLAGLWESPGSYFEGPQTPPPLLGGEGFSGLGEHLDLQAQWLRGHFPLAGSPSPVDSK